MAHYLGQVAPVMDWSEAKVKLWKSVDVFGREGSAEKEKGIKSRILD